MTYNTATYADWLNIALQAAAKAQTLLRAQWQQTHSVQYKGFRDIVTTTDVACESLILDHLHAALPQHTLVSEEGGGTENRYGGTETGNGAQWFVDPIDGTTNFSRNNPNFSTAIAAVVEGQPVVGVILDPLREHIFAAYRGGGATLNGIPIHVSKVTTLANAICAVDSPRDPLERRELWRRLGVLMTHGRTLRAIGSAALHMAYLAAGWIDVYFHIHLHPWDQAAAGLLIQEAGGVCATLNRNPWTVHSPDPLMTTSPALLNEVYTRMLEAAL